MTLQEVQTVPFASQHISQTAPRPGCSSVDQNQNWTPDEHENLLQLNE